MPYNLRSRKKNDENIYLDIKEKHNYKIKSIDVTKKKVEYEIENQSDNTRPIRIVEDDYVIVEYNDTGVLRIPYEKK